MLVLSRKVGERICVGDDITVEVRRIAGNRVALALNAPRHVRILRGELERAAHEFEMGIEKQVGGRDDEAVEYAIALGRSDGMDELWNRDYAI
ncbi:MAG: carbon storage regulator [Planctomycetes bacterium]|nr:carbon storage regulator [Planctomycetota bacterium]